MARKIVRIYYVFQFLVSLSISFFFATYVLFLTEAGLDLFEVNMVNAIFMLSCFLLEVPTGAVADLYGRKMSFVLACFINALAFFIYFVSGSFMMFVLAEVVGSVAGTLQSGAFKSWMIDEVNGTGEKFDLRIAYRRAKLYGGLGVMVGSVIGAYLGSIDLSYPWLASSTTFFITGVMSIFFIKENMFKHDKSKKSFRTVIRAANEGVVECLRNPALLFASLTCLLVGFSLMAINMYWQPRFVGLGFPQENLGWVFAGISLASILGAHFSGYLQAFSKSNKNAFLIMFTVIGMGMIGATSANVWLVVIPSFYVHQMARGMYEPVFDDYFNKRIDGSKRATMLSFCSMVKMLGAFFGLVTTGQIAKHINIEMSWVLSGLVLIIFVIVVVFRKK